MPWKVFVSLTLLLVGTDALDNNETWNGKWFPHAPGQNEEPQVEKIPELPPAPRPTAAPHDDWKGPWFPHPPGQTDDNRTKAMSVPESCDNGKDGLTVDFDPNDIQSQAVLTCLENRNNFVPNATVQPILRESLIPPAYSALHKCMNESIKYQDKIPTFGSHRAVWPKYGEYEFVPPQRWIHSLEHGAIVALYHPCANRQETLKYKKLVKQCLFRHVITPYEQLSSERPFALVAWGKSLEMSFVDLKLMIGFIRMNALQGPEAIDRDGAYEVMLVEAAKTVSTNDSSLCPSM